MNNEDQKTNNAIIDKILDTISIFKNLGKVRPKSLFIDYQFKYFDLNIDIRLTHLHSDAFLLFLTETKDAEKPGLQARICSFTKIEYEAKQYILNFLEKLRGQDK